ncbi:MAG TPA: peptidyl-prolyl cis-trans isomerase [Longimicrobiales bacterium]
MMQQLREKSALIIFLTILAFVALMVLDWGMDLTGRSSALLAGGELGRVNGEPITVDQYNAVYQNLYDQRQRESTEPLTSADIRQIEDAAWEDVVTQTLIRQELRRRGITASAEEIIQAARFAPPPEFYENAAFQTDGQFDIAKYHQFLASPAVNDQLLLQLEAYYREIIPRSKLFRQVAAGTYIPDGELWRMWREQYDSVRVRYLAIDPRLTIADDAVTVTDAEVEAYYRANQDRFARAARAEARVVALEKAPTPADSAAALERARRLRQEILDGADFAEVARRESADSGSASLGGDLGSFRRGELVPAFEQAAWSLPVGRVSEPVLSPSGYHLIRVDRRDADSVSAHHILIPIERTPESEEALLVQADSLETLGERLGIAEAASALGLPAPREITLNEDQPFVPGLGRLDEGAEWAFSEASPGDVSPLYETRSAYYMLELVGRTPAGVIPLEEARTNIRAELIARKKLERARAEGQRMVGLIRAGNTLDEVAAAAGLPVHEAGPFTRLSYVPGLGQANEAIGTAFGLAPGQTSGLVEASGKLFIIQVVERRDADRQQFEAQKDFLRARMTAGLERERVQRFLQDLRNAARIRDDRALVMRGSADAGT